MAVVARACAIPSRDDWRSFRSTVHQHDGGPVSSGHCKTIEELPETVLASILSYIHIKDQVAVAELVSKSWRHAIRLLPQSSLNFSAGGAHPQVSIEMVSRLVARAVTFSNTHQPSLDGSTVNPVSIINLSGCRAVPGQTSAQLLAYCINLCPNLQQLIACQPGHGKSEPTLPLSADGALQVLRAAKKHSHVRQIAVDVEAFGLTDTWETTSYQRAIGVEPLWQTLLLLLEPHSRVCINRLSFSGYRITGHARSSVAPSEMRKVISNRAKDLAAVLSRSPSLCGLMIPGNYLTPGAIEAIYTAAKVTNSIKALELSGRRHD
ncbi:hypothetical protein WJX74_010379 [Apatococcus lobatus]|uniref:F-box domain-containing protein n=1 Tax=Apatococcus lobatus TaxID=904363 RepID=A0AAW1Q7M9_9CHLO